MAVETPTSALIFQGNGSTTIFPITFPFLLESDIYVAVQDPPAAATLLTEGVDYTLTPTADPAGGYSGGSIETVATYSADYTITVFRQTPVTQITELPEAGPLPAAAIEKALDKVTMICQQLHRRVLELEGDGDGGAVVNVPSNPGGAAFTGVQIFADAAARGNAAASATGQLGVQLDDGSLWRAQSTVAGAWTPAIFSLVTKRVMARKTAGAGAMEECTISEVLDFLTSAANGDIPYRSSGAWGVKSAGVDVQEFTASGTWTKPAHAKWVEGYIVGGGGGGGSGRRGAAGAARFGGGGGAAGSILRFSFPASAVSTGAVVIGAGGAGGTAVTADGTNGNNGTAGAASTFGGMSAAGGDNGDGGTNASGAAGSAASTGSFDGMITDDNGGFASAAGASSPNANTAGDRYRPSGGGGGGSIDAANAKTSGGAGGSIGFGTGNVLLAASAGGGTSVAGTAGGTIGPVGGGGGGGGPGDAAAAGAGGAGARGGGGGGGGASLNGFNSGAGGAGGNGYVVIITY